MALSLTHLCGKDVGFLRWRTQACGRQGCRVPSLALEACGRQGCRVPSLALRLVGGKFMHGDIDSLSYATPTASASVPRLRFLRRPEKQRQHHRRQQGHPKRHQK